MHREQIERLNQNPSRISFLVAFGKNGVNSVPIYLLSDRVKRDMGKRVRLMIFVISGRPPPPPPASGNSPLIFEFQFSEMFTDVILCTDYHVDVASIRRLKELFHKILWVKRDASMIF
ncbi:hypothetical protein M9H77_34245 [Catharanthus roseus]|uniref:Uncharacterized protein n=1 Tax=Catharanthus roseus TaxID=4058 RepID=A0ACB9ZLC8_CATRO|nr:hypothetical protein M9H77_34245 [Catharanthus roseus]